MEWKVAHNALSNKVTYKENEFCKEYVKDGFKDAFGYNETTVFKILNRHYVWNDWNKVCFYEVTGKPITTSNLTDGQIIAIAKRLKAFHNLDAKIRIKPNYKAAWKVIKDVDQLDKLDKELAKRAFKILKKDKVLTHGDLVDGNILVNGKEINFIDFEYSGLANRLVDIASFCTERLISTRQQEIFIDAYYKGEEFNRADYETIRKFSILFWSKWALFKYKETHNSIYKDIYNWKRDLLNKKDDH